MSEVNRLGNIYGEDKGTGYAGNVWDKDNLCPTLTTMQGGGREPMIVIGGLQEHQTPRTDGISPSLTAAMGMGGGQTPMIVASRGRNPQNPSDRTPGNHVEQRLEPNSEGLCNTLTSVQKDNLVLEPQLKIVDIPQTVSVRKHKVDVEKLKKTLREHKKITNKEIAQKLDKPITMVEHWFRKDNSFSIPDADIWYQLKELLEITTDEFDLQVTEFIEQDGVADLSYPTSKTRRGRVQDGGDTCPTLTATETGICRIETPYRIRKLSPLECWLLMNFTEEDFRKAEKVNSNTQLYKQAGNSIVKAVLMAIFKQMM